MTESTITPKAVAYRLSALLKRTISPKQVRGRVRGDAGTPLLSRFGEGKAPYATHLYSVAEANTIGEAFVKSDNARTGHAVKWPAWNSKPAARKPAASPTAKRGTVKRAGIGNMPVKPAATVSVTRTAPQDTPSA